LNEPPKGQFKGRERVLSSGRVEENMSGTHIYLLLYSPQSLAGQRLQAVEFVDLPSGNSTGVIVQTTEYLYLFQFLLFRCIYNKIELREIFMRNLFKYLSSSNGRTIRFIGGSLISSVGLFISPILVVIGLLPFFAAVFDLCFLAPFFKLPLEGEKLRDLLSK